jgi:hypothetical protein
VNGTNHSPNVGAGLRPARRLVRWGASMSWRRTWVSTVGLSSVAGGRHICRPYGYFARPRPSEFLYLVLNKTVGVRLGRWRAGVGARPYTELRATESSVRNNPNVGCGSHTDPVGCEWSWYPNVGAGLRPARRLVRWGASMSWRRTWVSTEGLSSVAGGRHICRPRITPPYPGHRRPASTTKHTVLDRLAGTD